MHLYIPADFYPKPLKLSAGQKQRIHSLVERRLAGEKIYNVMPQRSLKPILVIIMLFALIGFTAAPQEVREFAAQAAAGITEFLTRRETDTAEETLPETESETQAETDTETEIPALEIGAETTVGDVRLRVEQTIRVEDGFYLKLHLDHLTGTFAGDILQFDTLSLSINDDPENQYRNSDRWYDLITYSWGEPGILAGEVFILLDREKPTESVDYWLFVGTERAETGQYRLQIDRLFGCDTYAAEFDCTEYGDFALDFTIAEMPEVIPADRLEPMTVFTIGSMEYTLRSIRIEPLSIEVEITSGRDSTFVPEGYPDLQLTPVHHLFGMYNAVSDLGLTGAERNALYEQQYNLIPHCSTDITFDNINSRSNSYTFHNDLAEEDTVIYHMVTMEPIPSDILRKLELVRMDGGDSLIIWEAE